MVSLSGGKEKISLASYEDFKKHIWITDLVLRYNEKDSIIAAQAVARLVNDLKDVNEEYCKNNKRVLFTSVEGRAKAEQSFFKKLYELCCVKTKALGISRANLEKFYGEVRDKAGVRFSCPYYDEIKLAVKTIRERLSTLGYATELRGDFEDNDYLDLGNEFGYRSYHFFVKVPTPIDIFATVELFPCEIQGRSELQHIWAVKSHDLLYKPFEGWGMRNADEHVIEDMKQLGNSLRAADQFLVSIRDRVKGGKP